MKVLLIEDHPDMLEILANTLNNEGFKVSTAIDTFVAKNLLDKESFDLIISDIKLPNETGISFAKKLRIQGIGLPILFYSSEANGEVFFHADIMEIGNAKFLYKDLNIPQLLKALREMTLRECYFINFLETEQKPNDGELYVHLGAIGYFYIDKSSMDFSEIRKLNTNIFTNRIEATEALEAIQKALAPKVQNFNLP